MKTHEIFLIIGIIEILIAIVFIILIRKTNKKLKELECKHKNVFHFISSEKDEKTCMSCGKRLKDKIN